ncbi:transcriptional repressor DicA [Roseivivax jejudonensis]|uniref:Transcriptional repressor DicA n=1 Tax=Roseivivax jejudonensis TaxID=1529041 RepID=A0A1X6YSF7_9RHOB|nr:helix-turn-helix transcriptional regulator [Roseivivax jejudonensis]SLN30093.1 transcriptional repressor DicA [Roseivivax jejudonensis]
MNSVDKCIGARVRAQRQARGLTQRDLGERLGVRFQQIQKYESGQNRISAAQMWRIASVLDVSITHFFEKLEIETPDDAAERTTPPLTPSQTRELASIFTNLDTSQREAVMAFLRSLATGKENVTPS